MRTGVVALLLAASPWQAGDATRPSAPAQPPTEYTIGPQDILRITVLGHDDLTQTVVIQPDGTFTYPLLGRVKADGLTAKQLETALAERLGRDFVRNPELTVVIQEYRSKSVFVVGEISRPGNYALAGSMTLIEILSKAGPLSGNASAEVVIVRPPAGASGPLLPGEAEREGGPQAEIIRVNVREIEAGNLDRNLRLRPNDTIFVPQAPKVFISGEVRSPGAYPLTPGTTVRQLIILAGGLTEDGSSGRIRVLRMVDGRGRETKIGLDDPVQPGDTILVKAKLF
jgi:polysaccharide export outer membrane protein